MKPYAHIYSIGYGGREPEEFIGLLKKHNIKKIVDVRKSPNCKWQPLYSKPEIADFLKENGIEYIHKPELKYNIHSWKKPDYSEKGREQLSQNSVAFYSAINWIIREASVDNRIALLCAEKSPFRCHRMLDVGKSLIENGSPTAHIIDEKKFYLQVHPNTFKRENMITV
ncbi:MAG TPA: DUF488 domain-containing protein [Bacteroidaceae bacterium]|nr:DUF488 domain-containing protein [Bacteroidaceae bacterium]